jgi:archaellin
LEKSSLVDNRGNSSVHPVLQLVSGPALNINPDFTYNTQDWIVGDWKATRIDKINDRDYNITTALHGKTKQTLLSENFILIDTRSSYLYIAAARTNEANAKLILTLQCYDKDQKKILGTISLPEATLTNTWSSYGDIINSDSGKYVFPKDTAFVKLAINLPQSKPGTDISAIRLVEMPQDTLSIIDEYATRFPKWKNGLWGFAKQWDLLVGCDTSKGMTRNYYKVETKGKNQTATSNIFRSDVYQKIFFTNYHANDENYNPILLQTCPKSAELIVVNVNVTKDKTTYTTLSLDITPSLGSRMALSWETTTDYNSDPRENEWVDTNLNDYSNQYKVKVSAKDKPIFIRCRANITYNDNPCNGLVAYSQVFKVLPNVVKVKKDEN